MKTAYFHGIHANTGKYAYPPRSLKDMLATIEASNLLKRNARAQEKYGAFVEDFVRIPLQDTPGVEQGRLSKHLSQAQRDDLAQAGWGILYPAGQPDLLKHLEPLLTLRRQQSGALYREIPYTSGQRRWDLMAQLDAPGFSHEPSKLPYYLLIVGHPKDIPFFIQYDLDRLVAVGRLALDRLEEYGHYARNVVRHEGRNLPQLKAVFYGTTHPKEPTTALSAQFLVKDLARRTVNSFNQVSYQISSRIGEEASKLTLGKLLGGSLTPDLLLTTSHGIILPVSARDRPLRQGALICSDWPGPAAWGGKPIPERFIYAGKDVPLDAQFNGMIALINTCFGGGTPHLSSFPLEPHLSHSVESPKPFIAHLPKRMLAVENGARAVIAHVDTAFIWSFTNMKKQEQTETYQNFFRRLLEGRMVGDAMNTFQRAHLDCLAEYQELVEAQNNNQLRWQDDKLVQAWFAVNDLRNLILLGDPAVRLPSVARA